MAAEPAAESVFLASRLEDLDQLWFRRGVIRPVEVRLAIPGLDEARRIELEARLSHQLRACGCGEGSAAASLYVVLVPLLVLTGTLGQVSVAGWIALAAGLLAVLFAGKVLGLALARRRLTRAVAEVERLVLDRATGR